MISSFSFSCFTCYFCYSFWKYIIKDSLLPLSIFSPGSVTCNCFWYIYLCIHSWRKYVCLQPSHHQSFSQWYTLDNILFLLHFSALFLTPHCGNEVFISLHLHIFIQKASSPSYIFPGAVSLLFWLDQNVVVTLL